MSSYERNSLEAATKVLGNELVRWGRCCDGECSDIAHELAVDIERAAADVEWAMGLEAARERDDGQQPDPELRALAAADHLIASTILDEYRAPAGREVYMTRSKALAARSGLLESSDAALLALIEKGGAS